MSPYNENRIRDRIETIDLAEYGLDSSMFWLLPNGNLVEYAPRRCPRGHDFGPGRVIVGGMIGQRTWACTTCPAIYYRGGVPGRHGYWVEWKGPAADR